MKITQNKLMTAAALGMAGLAAWYVLRKPKQVASVATDNAAAGLFATFENQMAGLSFGNAQSLYGSTLQGRGLYLSGSV
jgi:hypothetical protein